MHHELMRTLSLLCFILLIPFQAWAEDVDIAKLFSNEGITGTIVIIVDPSVKTTERVI